MLNTVCGTFKFFFDESDVGSGESQGPSACFSAKYCVQCGWGLSSLSHLTREEDYWQNFLALGRVLALGLF